VELGAWHVSQQMGLSLADAYGRRDGGGPIATTGLLRLLAVVIFLAIGGHRHLISGLFGSFGVLPLQGPLPCGRLLTLVVGLLAASFVVALKIAAPVLIALLLATVVFGFLQKTMPQCNILSTNLPARALVGLAVLAAALAAVAWAVESGWADALGRIADVLTAPGGG
jgi:flagellar biosynthetic protein FliR